MNCPSEGSETVARVALIGYARVATFDQNPELQHDALGRAGCERVLSTTPLALSMKGPSSPVRSTHLRAGDMLVVWPPTRSSRWRWR
jgi:hypothetical protein